MIRTVELVLAGACLILLVWAGFVSYQNRVLSDRMLELLYRHDQAHHHTFCPGPDGEPIPCEP